MHKLFLDVLRPAKRSPLVHTCHRKDSKNRLNHVAVLIRFTKSIQMLLITQQLPRGENPSEVCVLLPA